MAMTGKPVQAQHAKHEMSSANIPPSTLSRREVNDSLRAFVTASGMWGVWNQCLGIGTAAFTGYALFLGADEAFIPLFTTVGYLLAGAQLLSPILGRRLRNRKRFIVGGGFIEIACRASIILIPLVVWPEMRVHALLLLVSLSLLFGYAVSPYYSTWIANTVPENSRALFTSRQTIVSSVAAMVAGFVVGWFLDLFEEGSKYEGFAWVFAVGLMFGWLGYLSITRAPAPSQDSDDTAGSSVRMLLRPFKDRDFTLAVSFFGLWTLATGISGPLYTVFMLKHLHISYTEIALYNGVFMVTSIAGYRLWASLVDRFGSKPVLQLLFLPAAVLPVLWALNQPGAHYFVPIAMVLAGVLFSGAGVAGSPLLYTLLPAGSQRPYYMAAWSTAINLVGALGPMIGSFLALYLHGTQIHAGGFTFGNLQIIFFIAFAAQLLPFPFLYFLHDRRSTLSSRALLSALVRGNVLGYVYNATIFGLASAPRRRARAALALGRSRSPLATDQLIQALSDASPEVRRSAAQALGDSDSEEAMRRLVSELSDGASDVRAEAAEALGRLGHSSSIGPLLDALDDADSRVRVSAAQALAQIGGDEVQELLFWYLSESLDRLTFPTLVDALAGLGDHRVVRPALRRLGDFKSTAVRLQLLDSVCRCLGARDSFYATLSLDEDRRSTALTKLLDRAMATLGNTDRLPVETRDELHGILEDLAEACDAEDMTGLRPLAARLTALVRDHLHAFESSENVQPASLIILAIDDFLSAAGTQDLGAAVQVFLVVCIHRLSVAITDTPRAGADG